MSLPKSDHALRAFADASSVAELSLDDLHRALKENDEAAFMSALRKIVKENGGFSVIAQKTGINRTALYKLVSARHDPRFSTVLSLLPGLGLRLSVRRVRRQGAEHGKAQSLKRGKSVNRR
jgi:probable addiction module antidote protein